MHAVCGDIMSDEVKINECRAEDVDEALKQLWIDAIREGSISVLPTEENMTSGSSLFKVV
jgi:hypothetical protein